MPTSCEASLPTGKNIKALVDRTDEPHCLRLQKNRVFYVREDLMRRATNVGAGAVLSACARWKCTRIDLGRPCYRLELCHSKGMHALMDLPSAHTFSPPSLPSSIPLPLTSNAPPAPHPAAPPRLPPPQVARDKLVALGTCIGKFTHSGKFRVTVGALDVLAQYAKYKVGTAVQGSTGNTTAVSAPPLHAPLVQLSTRRAGCL